jgi:hypothetical protein
MAIFRTKLAEVFRNPERLSSPIDDSFPDEWPHKRSWERLECEIEFISADQFWLKIF